MYHANEIVDDRQLGSAAPSIAYKLQQQCTPQAVLLLVRCSAGPYDHALYDPRPGCGHMFGCGHAHSVLTCQALVMCQASRKPHDHALCNHVPGCNHLPCCDHVPGCGHVASVVTCQAISHVRLWPRTICGHVPGCGYITGCCHVPGISFMPVRVSLVATYPRKLHQNLPFFDSIPYLWRSRSCDDRSRGPGQFIQWRLDPGGTRFCLLPASPV